MATKELIKDLVGLLQDHGYKNHLLAIADNEIVVKVFNDREQVQKAQSEEMKKPTR